MARPWVQFLVVAAILGSGLYFSHRWFDRFLNPTVVDLARQSEANAPPLELPQKSTNLYVVLPPLSAPGVYELKILSDPETQEVALASSGSARPQHGSMVLNAAANLGRLKPGHYVLGVRKKAGEWSYYPVRIR